MAISIYIIIYLASGMLISVSPHLKGSNIRSNLVSWRQNEKINKNLKKSVAHVCSSGWVVVNR